MKSKQYGALFGILAVVAILSIASETTIMSASAQSVLPGRHCTASQPCVQICGDHVCAPGELAQMKLQAVQNQRNINSANMTAAQSAGVTPSSSGVIVGGVVSYMDEASDGTAVIVRTGHPISGQALDIGIAFKDANNNFIQHQNYAITVSQDGNTVFSNPTGHTHTGTDSMTTSVLSSGNPINIQVTLNGIGLPTADPSTWTGVKGEVLNFTQITDVKALENMTDASAPATTSSNTTSAGNATVPEFGPVASIVLAIAVLSVVVFAAKTRVIPRL